METLLARAIVELVGDKKIERLQILLQRADRADGDDPLHAKLLHGMDVGAIIDFRREKAMAARMSCEERDALSLERPHDERIRRGAERSLDAQLARVLEARHVVQPAASNDADADRIETRAPRLRLMFRSRHE